MATWIAHMRIAEYFMQRHPELNNVPFLVGNIGPDCGVPNQDWSSFTPSKLITHWHIKGDSEMYPDDFRQRYLSGSAAKDPRTPFYTGYYFHLLTDVAWRAFYAQKRLEPAYVEGFREQEDFTQMIKRDWYGHDHVYLKHHPDCIFYTMFAKIEAFPNDFLDFFPSDAFTRQIRYITHFYMTASEDEHRPYPYLSAAEWDAYIETICAHIDSLYFGAQP